MAVRKSRGKHHNSLSPFSAKIVCGDCGEFYGSKVWHSTDKYRRVIWQCNGKFKGKDRCATPHLYEENIKRLFLRAVAQLTEDREVLLKTGRMIHDEYLNTDAINAECATLNDEIEIVSGPHEKADRRKRHHRHSAVRVQQEIRCAGRALPCGAGPAG